MTRRSIRSSRCSAVALAAVVAGGLLAPTWFEGAPVPVQDAARVEPQDRAPSRGSPADAERIALDVARVQRARALLFPDSPGAGAPTLSDVRAMLGGNVRELGFGVRRVSAGALGGYTVTQVRMLAFGERLAWIELTVTSDDSWPLVAAQLRSLLGAGAEPFDRGVRRRWQDERLQQELRAHVAKTLFADPALRLDPETAAQVAELTDPMREDLFDMGGLAGPLPSRRIVDRWVEGRQVDALRALLRGPNEVMRVYAVEALRTLHSSGVPLAERDRAAIDSVMALDVELDASSGCVVLRGTAASVLAPAPR